MEHQLWKSIVDVLLTLDKPRTPTRFTFRDEAIVKVYYWAVLHDRPTCWACGKNNWPLHLRKQPLPSPAALSRRLRSASVKTLLEALQCRVLAPKEPSLFWIIDGQPLVIGGCSKDRQAGYGRAAGSKGKGYKVHTVLNSAGEIACWRVTPMNKDERVMAERLLQSAPEQVLGYVVADSNYDSTKLHQVADERGNLQLVTRRRSGPGKATGHRQQAEGRLHCLELVENPYPAFAEQLLHDRWGIERQFGNGVNWGGGLQGLPSWVRTHRRVHRWVQAKLILTRLKHDAQIKTYAA